VLNRIGAILVISIAWNGIGIAEEITDSPQALRIEHVYTGEEFGNVSGGIKKGHSYRGNFDLTLTVDTEKANVWKGGMFFLYFENGHGKGITNEYVGDLQVLSNIDAREFSQISEYYIGQSFMDDRLRLKIGKQDANKDFNVTDSALEFINSSFGLMPNVPIPTFPDPSLGVSGCISLTGNVSMKAGIFDGEGRGGSWGFSTAFGSDATSVSIGELGITNEYLGNGALKLGAWRRGGKSYSLRGTRMRTSNYGGYLILEERIIGSDEEKDTPCLTSFVQYGAAPGEFNEITNYIGFGIRASGFAAPRPEDSFGLGMARAVMSDDLPLMKDETALEAYYLAPFRNIIMVQPDIQYILNPGGNGRDALVTGIRFGLEF
jgi:porin